MDIVIHSMGMPFNGNTILTQSLGGSESAAYYMGRELARRGHRVIMFTNSQEQGKFDNVEYCYSGQVTKENPLGERFTTFACNTPHDVLIIQRHPLAFHKDYASKINVLQMHDLALRRSSGAFNAGGARIDMVTAVSDFHRKQIEEVYGFRPGLTRVVPNGVDPEIYTRGLTALPSAFKAEDGELCFLYQSRPERGLEHLVRPGGIMDRLASVGSKARLFVCGYEYTTSEMAGFYQHLNDCCDALPNVVRLGALTKVELAQVQMRCDALVYPTEFEEVSCITAMEAMMAGLPFISSAHAALPETCKDSGSILLPLKDGHADEDAFVEALLTFEQNEAGHAAYIDAQRDAAETRTWEDAVDALEHEIVRIFETRASSPARMARHLIEHSDISTLDVLSDIDPSNRIYTAAIEERRRMYAFADPSRVVAHYEKWEGMNCDRMEARGLDPEAEKAGVSRTTRFRGIVHMVAKATSARADAGMPVRALEFGCAHGHITLLLAEMFPQVQFVGMDFMERSIELARKTATARGLTNVSFIVGSLPELPGLGAFDAVIAPEVVEHIWDYRDALIKLVQSTAMGGYLITTTPTGRWEWSGRDWWPKGREHLHHFEREDLIELFGEFPNEILHAPGGHEMTGGALGSWVVGAQRTEGAAIGEIDYTRKLRTIAPRDTVSLCMIVKNAEVCIQRAIASVANFVDEVVIALDETTDDRTEERIDELRSDFPHVPFKVLHTKSPMEIGFDAARNATIDASCGDWILWLDADEELTGANNIWRCLRPGAFNAYSIAQHHLSQRPAAVITTDFPCRLFRRDSGARFYGVVHEHPEVKVGSAIPHTQSLGDVSIMHHGYTDEATRRARYARNYPLLLRDLEANPDRILNKFLYLRDLSQGIAFEGEQTGGVSPEMVRKAQECVRLFGDMIDKNPMLRMTLDALPYYTTASATLMSADSFHAKIAVSTKKDELPGVEAVVNVEGLFHNRETYERLLAKIAKETTSNYEARYL